MKKKNILPIEKVEGKLKKKEEEEVEEVRKWRWRHLKGERNDWSEKSVGVKRRKKRKREKERGTLLSYY